MTLAAVQNLLGGEAAMARARRPICSSTTPELV